MFDRFTDRARKVMGLAKAEAQRLNHEYIATEHVLLGLLQEGTGVGANVLKRMKVDFKRLRRAVEAIARAGEKPGGTGNLPFTSRAKKVLELAVAQASNLGHNYIGTEHLLLGLIEEHEGVAARVLADFAVKLEAARDEILEFLGADLRFSHGHDEAAEAAKRERPVAPPAPSRPFVPGPPSIAQVALETLGRLPPAPLPRSGATAPPTSPPVEPRRDVVDRLRRRLDSVRRAEARLRAQLAACESPRGREASGGEDRTKPTRHTRAVVERVWVASRQPDSPVARTEQLLIALLDDVSSLLPRCLARIGFDREALSSTISRWSDHRVTPTEPSPPLTAAAALSPELSRVIDRAYALAEAGGRRHVAVGHLVLALLEDPEDAAVAGLVAAGVDLAALRREVERALDDDGAADQIEALSDGFEAAAIAAGGLRFDFDQLEEDLRAFEAVLEGLRLKVEG